MERAMHGWMGHVQEHKDGTGDAWMDGTCAQTHGWDKRCMDKGTLLHRANTATVICINVVVFERLAAVPAFNGCFLV